MLQQVQRKVVNALCLAYDTILLPLFETQQIVKRPKHKRQPPDGPGHFYSGDISNSAASGPSKVRMRGNLNKQMSGARMCKYTSAKCDFQCGHGAVTVVCPRVGYELSVCKIQKTSLHMDV